jgi:hypothetical protein
MAQVKALREENEILARFIAGGHIDQLELETALLRTKLEGMKTLSNILEYPNRVLLFGYLAILILFSILNV